MSIPQQWPKTSTTPPFPVLQVATSFKVAQFNLLLPCNQEYNYSLEIWAEWENITGTTLSIKPVNIRHLLYEENKEWQLIRVRFENLFPDTEYRLYIVTNNAVDCRFFKTFASESKPLKFAFSNCLNDETIYIDIQKNIYAQLSQEKPDLLILGGDLVYVDSRERWSDILDGPQEKDCLVRYLETWQRLDLFKMTYLIPTISIWDDHDYGINDGDRNFPHKETTLMLHQCFFGADNIDNVFLNFSKGRVSIFSYQKQAFLLLDNRYFRLHDDLTIYSELSSINELDYQTLYQYFIQQYSKQRYNLFGQEQEDWLLKQVKLPFHQFIWLVGGNQFFANHHLKESYSRSNPENFYYFFQRIKEVGKPFAILSGDIHLSEFSRYYLYGENEEPVYEFGAGPFHSTMKLSDCQQDCYEKFINPYRIKNEVGAEDNLVTAREFIRAQNPDLGEEIIEKLATYGLACFRYNFAIFVTELLEKKDKLALDTRVKIVSDNCNSVFNLATYIY